MIVVFDCGAVMLVNSTKPISIAHNGIGIEEHRIDIHCLFSVNFFFFLSRILKIRQKYKQIYGIRTFDGWPSVNFNDIQGIHSLLVIHKKGETRHAKLISNAWNENHNNNNKNRVGNLCLNRMKYYLLVKSNGKKRQSEEQRHRISFIENIDNIFRDLMKVNFHSRCRVDGNMKRTPTTKTKKNYIILMKFMSIEDRLTIYISIPVSVSLLCSAQSIPIWNL